MDQIGQIQQKIAALLKARNYLLSQNPSDMVALAEITEDIVELNRRQSALASNLQLTNEQVQNLQAAVQSLDNEIAQSKTASDIIAAATTLMSAA